jgi:hypothetical protein
MLNVPTLTEMVTVIGVALLIAAIAVIALGALGVSVARRSQTTTAGPVSAIPAPRRPVQPAVTQHH